MLIKLHENCTHVYILSNFSPSGVQSLLRQNTFDIYELSYWFRKKLQHVSITGLHVKGSWPHRINGTFPIIKLMSKCWNYGQNEGSQNVDCTSWVFLPVSCLLLPCRQPPSSSSSFFSAGVKFDFQCPETFITLCLCVRRAMIPWLLNPILKYNWTSFSKGDMLPRDKLYIEDFSYTLKMSCFAHFLDLILTLFTKFQFETQNENVHENLLPALFYLLLWLF